MTVDIEAMVADLTASLEWARLSEDEARSAGNERLVGWQLGRMSALREAMSLLKDR